MKALLCLLSDQHVPNLLSVHHFKPDCLVLIESAAMKQKRTAENFKHALGLAHAGQKPVELVVEPLRAEDDLADIRDVLSRVGDRFLQAEWIVNLTGGTKPMSIAAYDFFKNVGARLVYTNGGKPAEFIDLDYGTHRVEKCEYRLSIAEFLTGYGFKPQKKLKHLQAEEERAHCWWGCARAIALHASADSLLSLHGESRSRAREEGCELKPGWLQTTNTSVADAIQRAFRLQRSGPSLVGSIDKYAARFLSGGWLEVFFFCLVHKHAAALGIEEVRLNYSVRSNDPGGSNEFDVVFIREHTLHMLECKSGSQVHDKDVDALYKIEAVARQFRALRVRSFLAIAADTIIDKVSGAVKKDVQNRADLYNCRILARREIERLAADPENAANVRDTLFPAAGATVHPRNS